MEQLIDQVNLDSLVHHVRVLSGEDSVLIGDSTVLIETRYVETSGNRAALGYLKQYLMRLGLEVVEYPFTYDHNYGPESGTNLLGIQKGSDLMGRKLILGAHFDSVSKEGPAPGANDNASGTAIVLEAARLLSPTATHYTVVYAFWDAEERGRQGSQAYAGEAKDHGESIVGVLNLDMLGYGPRNPPVMMVGHPGSSEELVQHIQNTNSVYDLGFDYVGRSPGSTSSDFQSFAENEFDAVGLIDEAGYFYGLRYPKHTSEDRIALFTLDSYHQRAKLAIASLAHYALDGVIARSIPESVERSPHTVILQSFPNPSHESTTISYTLPGTNHVRITVSDVLGRQVRMLVDGVVPGGRHEALFEAGDLPSGLYIARLVTPQGTFVQKMLLLK